MSIDKVCLICISILYHNSVKPYMETLCYHMNQLKAILRIA